MFLIDLWTEANIFAHAPTHVYSFSPKESSVVNVIKTEEKQSIKSALLFHKLEK